MQNINSKSNLLDGFRYLHVLMEEVAKNDYKQAVFFCSENIAERFDVKWNKELWPFVLTSLSRDRKCGRENPLF